MKKESIINIRTPGVVKQHIYELVQRAENVKNVSDLVNKAILYYLTHKYNISVDGQSFYIGEYELDLINSFVPAEMQQELKDQIIEDHASTIQKLENFQKKFFLEGIEERIEILPDPIDGLEPDILDLLQEETDSLVDQKKIKKITD